MEYKDFKQLLTWVPFLSNIEIHPRIYLNILRQRGTYLDASEVHRINNLVDKENILSEKLNVFFFEISKSVEFSVFNDIRFAELMGALATSRQSQTQTRHDVISIVSRPSNHSPELYDIFSKWKKNVDNKTEPNLLDKIKSLKTRGYDGISRSQNPNMRDKMANRIAVLTWLQNQLYRDVDFRIALLEDFRNRLGGAELSEDSFINTVYYCKMACTLQLRGEFERAMTYINTAEYHAHSSNFPFARTIVHHDRQYIFRKRNVQERTSDNVAEVIRSCENGLTSLMEIDSGDMILLKRIFIMNIVQALLGIGPFLEIDTEEMVQNQALDRAKRLLHEVKIMSKESPMENRRQMMYSLSMARLSQLQGSENEAMLYLEQTRDLSCSGAVLSEIEKSNIAEYISKVNE